MKVAGDNEITSMKQSTALCPSHYARFNCIGTQCEDSCCIGWRVHLDKKTYHFYKQNQHKALRHLFQNAVKRSDTKHDDQQFGLITMGEDGRCAFLDEENLCRIQRTLGFGALSKVCATFPRRANQTGEQLEYSLTISCPEAARLVLLDQEPMRFNQIALDPSLESGTSPGGTAGNDNSGRLILNDLRALIIAILQSRGLTVDGRLILLGLLLEDFDQASQAESTNLPALQQDILQRYIGLLGDQPMLQQDFNQIEPNLVLKMSLVTAIVGNIPTSANNLRFREVFREAAEGLAVKDSQSPCDSQRVARHVEAHEKYYAPYFNQNTHILENYLVHYVFHNLFPFARSTLLAQYREMVCHYLAVTTLLLGQAGYHSGMTDERAVKTIQSYTRFSGHYTQLREIITRTLDEKGVHSLQDLFQTLSTLTRAGT